MAYTTPGIILKSRTITNHSNAHFSNYLDYEKRTEAIKLNRTDQPIYDEKDRLGYLKYMTNSRKLAPNANDLASRPKSNILYGVASKDQIDISIDEYHDLKKQFDFIQKNTPANMYIDVVSFDNKFLAENGLYDAKNHQLDHRKLLAAIQDGLKDMAKKASLSNDTLMLAAIHRNTDNIHVHCTTIDPNEKNNRYFRRKYAALKAFKSKVANKIIGDANTKMLRNIEKQRQMLKVTLNPPEPFDKKHLNAKIAFIKEKHQRLLAIKQSLPANYLRISKKSRSHAVNMKSAIKLAENYVNWYFEQTNPQLFADFKKSLLTEQAYFERVYGRNPRWHAKEIPKLTYYRDNSRMISLPGTLAKDSKGNWHLTPRSRPAKTIKYQLHQGYSLKKIRHKYQLNPQNRQKILSSHKSVLKRSYRRTVVGTGKDNKIVLKAVRENEKPLKLKIKAKYLSILLLQKKIEPEILQKKLILNHEMDLPTAQKKMDRFMKESQNMVLDQAQKWRQQSALSREQNQDREMER